MKQSDTSTVQREKLQAVSAAWQDVLGLITDHVPPRAPFWNPAITHVGESEATCPLLRVTLLLQDLERALPALEVTDERKG